MPISARELARGVSRLAALPDVCLQVNEMVEEGRHSAEDFARVIRRDPGLTSQLLRLANSAYYGLTKRVETISRAVTVIGTRGLRDMVLASSVFHRFSALSEDPALLDDYWRHSLEVGCLARVLARGASAPVLHQERLFVAGLLHDIGRLVMAVRIPELLRVMNTLARTQGLPMREAERLVFDLDHCEVGAALLKDWGLPALFREVAACHHAPGVARQHPLEVALVHAADVLARERGEVSPDVWALLGMNERQARRLIRESRRETQMWSQGLLRRG